jgi:hypothetical protein
VRRLSFLVFLGGCAAAAHDHQHVERTQARRGPSAHHPIGEITRRTLRSVDGKSFEKRAARVRLLPVKAGGVFFANVPFLGSHAMVGTAPSHWGNPSTWSLVDLVNGARGDVLADVQAGSAATHSAVAVSSSHTGVVDLESGRFVAPDARLESGEHAAQLRVMLDERKAVTWLVARMPNGRIYDGAWPDLAHPIVELSEVLPFWPVQVSGQNGLQAWREPKPGLGDACDRAIFEAGWPLRCRPLSSAAAAPYDIIEDCVRWDGAGKLVDDCAAPLEVPCARPLRPVVLSSTPPRALVVCVEDGGPAHFTLWSKAQTFTFDDAPAAWSSPTTERGPRTMVPLDLLGKNTGIVSRWLDVEHGVLWQGPPLRALPLSEHRDDHRRLVQSPDHLNELWLLDLDQGTFERIADDIDCDAPLYEYAHVNERAVVSCLPRAAEGSLYMNETRLRSWRWTEVIDLGARTRWRTTEVFEPRVTTTGMVVGTRRGKPAQLAVIETP